MRCLLVFFILACAVAADKPIFVEPAPMADEYDSGRLVGLLEEGVASGKAAPELKDAVIDLGDGEAVRVMVLLRENRHRSSGDLEDVMDYVGSSQERVVPFLGEGEFRLRYRFALVNGFSGYATKAGLVKLLEDDDVASVAVVDSFTLHMAESVSQVNATDVWNTQYYGVNLTGRDTSVCVIDSGVNYSHPDLGGCSVSDFTSGSCGKVPWGMDYADDDNNPMDTRASNILGHGTHVAGTVASEDTTDRGLAPDAKIIAMKVFKDSGSSGGWDDIAKAIEACTLNKSKYNITVITMSLGTSSWRRCSTGDCSSDPYWDSYWGGVPSAIESAYNEGIFVDASSGNEASTSGIGFPACNEYTVSVGDVYDYDGGGIGWSACSDSAANVDVDKVVCHANRCSILDLWAPGALITSCDEDGAGTADKGGTSMAAPHVAAAATLLQQYAVLVNDSYIPPAHIKDALVESGVNITRDVTKPRIDVHRALRHLNFKAPKLSGEAVSPASGLTSTVFNFTVNYTEVEDQWPDSIYVNVDGVSFEMSTEGSDPRGTVAYYYETTLSGGAHDYNFTAVDGGYVNESALVSGSPDVNWEPTLTSLSEADVYISDSELFNFTVNYSDLDSEAASYTNLLLAGSLYGMAATGSSWAAGVVFYHNRTVSSLGRLSYRYNTSDGNYTILSSSFDNLYVYASNPACDGADPVGESAWNVAQYSNCSSTAVLPSSTRTGPVNVTSGNTLYLNDSTVYVNNTLLSLDGVLEFENSVLEFIL